MADEAPPPDEQNAPDPPDDRDDSLLHGPRGPGAGRQLELLIAVILGVAAILTAYASFQTDLADGDSLKYFQEGGAIYDDANQQYLEGNQQVQNDVTVFAQYASATYGGNRRFAQYIKDGLMDPELLAATEEWEESEDELPSPFEADAYEIPAYERAESLTEQGDKLYDEANLKDKEGDDYKLATVFLAVALFFAGVAGVTGSRQIAVTTTVFSIVLIVGSSAYMLTL